MKVSALAVLSVLALAAPAHAADPVEVPDPLGGTAPPSGTETPPSPVDAAEPLDAVGGLGFGTGLALGVGATLVVGVGAAALLVGRIRVAGVSMFGGHGRTTYLVVDRSRAVRAALVAALARRDHGGRVLETETTPEGLALFRDERPQVVFLGLGLDDATADVAAVETMLAEVPDTRVVVVGVHPEDHPAVLKAFDLGAQALLRKPLRDDAVERALDVVCPATATHGRIAPLASA